MEHARLSQMSSHSASPSPNQDKVIDRSGLHRLFLCKIFKSVGQFSEQIAEDYGSYLFNEAENWDTVRHCLMLRLYLPRLPDSSSLHIIFVSKPETWDLRPDTWDLRPETWDLRPETWPENLERCFAGLGWGVSLTNDDHTSLVSRLWPHQTNSHCLTDCEYWNMCSTRRYINVSMSTKVSKQVLPVRRSCSGLDHKICKHSSTSDVACQG